MLSFIAASVLFSINSSVVNLKFKFLFLIILSMWAQNPLILFFNLLTFWQILKTQIYTDLFFTFFSSFINPLLFLLPPPIVFFECPQ